MTTWKVFAAGSPANADLNDNTRYTLTTGWRINQPGSFWCTGVEWFAPATLPSEDIKIGLFLRVDDLTPGALLESKTITVGTLTPGVRNALLFDTPVPVSDAQASGYYAAVWTADRYTSTSGYFGADDTSGPVTAWMNGGVGANGRFAADVLDLTYPTGAFGASGYWMSPIVTDEDPGGETDLNLLDASSPALAGGTADRLLADLVWTDRSGPVLAGGTADALASILLLPDRSGPGLAGGTADALVREMVLLDRSGPAAAGGSAAALTEEPATPLELEDQVGPGGLAGGSFDVLEIAEASGDLSVLPVVLAALACLEDAADTLPSPPKHRSVRGGNSVIAGIDQITDECCEGLAWVRVVNVSPTSAFPSPESGWTACPPAELSVELEFGILRCSPYFAGGQNDAQLPTPAMHLATVQAVLADAAAMRAAACCLARTRPVVIGTWSPVDNEANCTGGTLRVTVAAPFCERTC